MPVHQPDGARAGAPMPPPSLISLILSLSLSHSLSLFLYISLSCVQVLQSPSIPPLSDRSSRPPARAKGRSAEANIPPTPLAPLSLYTHPLKDLPFTRVYSLLSTTHF